MIRTILAASITRQMALVDPAQSVLVVIDAQQEFYPSERIDVDRRLLSAMLNRAAWLTAVAARLGVPVVVTEEDAAINGETVQPIRDALAPGTPVLPKWTFGAPDNPEILSAVQATGADTMVLIGLETDVCVCHSALGFQQLGKRVIALHDVVFSPGPAHDNGLGRMARAGIELLSAKELTYDWLRTVTRVREFFRAHPELADPPGFEL